MRGMQQKMRCREAIGFQERMFMNNGRPLLVLTVSALFCVCGLGGCQSKSVAPGETALCTSPAAVTIPGNGGYTAVTVRNCGNNKPFAYIAGIQQGDNWMWISPDSGSAPDTVYIYAEGSREGVDRVGRIIITAEGISGSPDTIVVTQPRSPWRTRQSMPTARAASTAVEVNGKIYVIGGWDGPNVVEEYDPAANVWVTKQAMPTGRSQLAAAVVNGKIYAIGGSGAGGFLNTVEEYDPAKDTWTSRQSMPTPRSGLAAVTVNGKIFAIGGASDAYTIQDAVEEYDPATDVWTIKRAMPTSREGLAAAAVNGAIYCIGGTNGVYFSSFASVEEYDPIANVWTARRPMSVARWALAAATLNDKIYAVGGWSGSTSQHAIEEYNPLTNVWTTRSTMPTSRGHPAAATAIGKIYVIGGAGDNSRSLDTVEEYDPDLDQ